MQIKLCGKQERRPLINYKGEDYIDWDDTLSYNQIYSQIEHYYVAKSGWEVKTYAFQQNQIVETVIRPSSFGSYPNCTTSPTDAFKYLYEFIKRENSSHDIIKESTWDDIDIESDYHYLDKHEFQLPPFSREYKCDTLWLDMPYGKIFMEEEKTNCYSILTNVYKISKTKRLYVAIATITEAIIAFLIVKAIRASRRMRHKISLNWKAILPKKRRETSASVEYSALLQKLNPVNFMHPYDAEKVRIANDLYSALLKSKGNDTIIQMIYEKGKDELGIV